MPRPSRDAAKQAVIQAARQRAEFVAARAAQRAKLLASTPAEFRQATARQYDRDAQQQADKYQSALDQAITAAEGALVLRAPPTRRPPSAAEASWCAALAASAPAWTPDILASELQAAARNQDRASMGILLPLARSHSEYKKEFVGHLGLRDAIREASDAIVTDEERRSDEDARWIAACRRESAFLNACDKASNPIDALRTNLEMTVFKTLFPGTAKGPSFDSDGTPQEPQRPALPNLDALAAATSTTGSTPSTGGADGGEQP